MIAKPLPYEEFAPPSTGTRSGRTAGNLRRNRTRTRGYASLAKILATASVLTLAIVLYLGLMANVTRMNYDLSRATRENTHALDESSRLDDQIARLASRERLARLATSLHMREPQSFAQVTLPARRSEALPHGLDFLPWLK